MHEGEGEQEVDHNVDRESTGELQEGNEQQEQAEDAARDGEFPPALDSIAELDIV